MSFFDDASLVFLPSGQAGKDGKAYSMKPTNGDGDFTFSRGSNLTATRVDSNGLIEKGRENLLLQSNQFDTTWTDNNCNITSGQSGYDGSTDAWKITSTNTGSAFVRQNIVSSGVQTASVYAAKGNVDYIYFRIAGSTNQGAFINLSNGTIDSYLNQGNIIDISVNNVSGDWYRISITFNTTTSDIRFYASDSGGSSSAIGSYIYIQDAQLEIGLTSTEYIESGASTGLAGILEDSPRFDYSGGASCPSLLLEGSRTNLVEYSEYGGSWNAAAATINDNATTSPEGLSNAVELNVTSNAGSMYYNIAVTAETDYVFSFYVKQGTNTENYLALRDNSNAVFFDADTSYITSSTEWKRIEHSFTTPVGCTDLRIYPQRYSSGGTGTTFFYGFQVEEGSYPTSYIPNHSGGSVTREADVCGGAGTSSTFNDSEGVLYAEISALADDGTYRILSINDGTKNERVYMQYTSTTNEISVVVKNGNSTQANIPFILSDETQYAKVAVRYKANDFALYINGTQRGTDTSGRTPVGLDNFSFDQGNGTTNFYGNVKQVLVFNTALSDPEMIALTS